VIEEILHGHSGQERIGIHRGLAHETRDKRIGLCSQDTNSTGRAGKMSKMQARHRCFEPVVEQECRILIREGLCSTQGKYRVRP